MRNTMNYGDYTVRAASYPKGITPLEGITASSGGNVVFSQSCQMWSYDHSNISSAVDAAKAADVTVVVVGTWSRDEIELWAGINATAGEQVDIADQRLLGAMFPLVRAIVNMGKPTIVVISSGKPVAEPCIYSHTSAVLQ
jgi:beta-glucosidase